VTGGLTGGLTGTGGGVGARIWARDASLWAEPGSAEAKEVAERLGWLDLPERMPAEVGRLEAFAAQVRADGLERVLVCGMGGSSLCVEVLARVFGPGGAARPPGAAAGLPVRILDSTHPDAVADAAAWAPPATSLYVIASKSGTTVEPNDFAAYFEQLARESLGGDAGSRFVAVTDPGTPLVEHARGHGWREAFLNPPDIGGRYSALSMFGLVPAALLGVDPAGLLERARRMAAACGPDVADRDNPAVTLGRFMAEQARAGRDKVTVLTPPALASFGLWVEQLLAESTGKHGTGLLPVVGEPVPDRPAEAFGGDRAFVAVGLAGARPPGAAALEAAGRPVLALDLPDGLALGGEFLRWELATAAAGHLLGVNPFDQPDVQAAKDATERVLAALARGEDALADPEEARLGGVADLTQVAAAVRGLLTHAAAGSYVALTAYVHPTDAGERVLQAIRALIRDTTGCATTVGTGPRFLHSTGQYHKGGPNTGRFLQITDTPATDPEVPGREYTFGTLIAGQAAGDRAALVAGGRRVLHVHLTRGGNLEILEEAVRVALGRSEEA
jgi:transaldolase/glucose-6-phosphate isomerase